MTVIETSDGLTLEAEWSTPPGRPIGVLIFCHPHPRHGGTMRAPLMRAVAHHLETAGFAVLRFNFRGVGGSQGSWGGGDAEVGDVASAVAAARAAHPGVDAGIVGWSFGSVTALRWQAATGDTMRYVGIAPALQIPGSPGVPEPTSLAPADRLFIIGDRDQFTDASDLADYAASIGASLEVVRGSDHFFTFRDHRVAGLAAAHFGGEVPVPGAAGSIPG